MAFKAKLLLLAFAALFVAIKSFLSLLEVKFGSLETHYGKYVKRLVSSLIL